MMGLTGLQVGVTITCDVENSVNSSGIQPCNKPTCTMLTPVYKRLVNPFAPGDFAEKRILKLVEWFSGHCRAIKS